MSEWKPSSWRNKKALHQANYPDLNELELTEKKLKKLPPLVFAGEVVTLKKYLAEVAEGKAFLLQGGDCAESFVEFSAENIRDTFKVILQMTVALMYGTGCPVVKIGRIAGQFGKPRSSPTEEINGITLPAYKGDIINGMEFTEKARTPDPQRLIRAYHQSASTMNLLRAFSMGGMASLEKINQWNLKFIGKTMNDKYLELANHINEIMSFMKACKINPVNNRNLTEAEFFISHEALLLNYEEAFTRIDSFSGKYVDGSAHMLWIGDRTRSSDSAHVEFLRGVINPIGIKVGPTSTSDDLLRIIDILNPKNEKGKIVLISRMGAGNVGKHLPQIIQAVKKSGKYVVWSCDPMHGNTIKSSNGYKTRTFADICQEVGEFFDIHKSEGTYAGGVHFEMTGQNVTECLGGNGTLVEEENLSERYHTHCDPRMNAGQALEISFWLANRIKHSRMK